jgi:heme oxygenase
MSTLKELTKERHMIAESQPFIKSIFDNNVDKEKYTDYLYQLYHVYYQLEKSGEKLFKGIEDMMRHMPVLKDFIELVGARNYKNIINPSTKKYLDYIVSISDNDKKLLAHIYVRHMGDLFGGQQLKKLVPGAGRMYEFSNVPGLIVEMRRRCGPELADEANVAFDFNIDIIKDFN